MRPHRPTPSARPLPAAVLALALVGMAGCSGLNSQIGAPPLPGATAARRRPHRRCGRALDPGRARPAGARLHLCGLRRSLRAGRGAADHDHLTAHQGRRFVSAGPGDDDPVLGQGHLHRPDGDRHGPLLYGAGGADGHGPLHGRWPSSRAARRRRAPSRCASRSSAPDRPRAPEGVNRRRRQNFAGTRNLIPALPPRLYCAHPAPSKGSISSVLVEGGLQAGYSSP